MFLSVLWMAYIVLLIAGTIIIVSVRHQNHLMRKALGDEEYKKMCREVRQSLLPRFLRKKPSSRRVSFNSSKNEAIATLHTLY